MQMKILHDSDQKNVDSTEIVRYNHSGGRAWSIFSRKIFIDKLNLQKIGKK